MERVGVALAEYRASFPDHAESLLVSRPGMSEARTKFLLVFEYAFVSVGRTDDLMDAVKAFLFWTATSSAFADYNDGYIFSDEVVTTLKAALAETTDALDSWCLFSCAATAMSADEVTAFFRRVRVADLVTDCPDRTMLMMGSYVRCALNRATHPYVVCRIAQDVRVGERFRHYAALMRCAATFRNDEIVLSLLSSPQIPRTSFFGMMASLLLRSPTIVVDAAVPSRLKTHLRACLDDPTKPVYPFPTEACAMCRRRALGTMLCTRCKTARYCSLGCQRRHWSCHKHECN